MTELDESLALQSSGVGAWRAYADPRREAFGTTYGGWIAAILLKAVLDDSRAEGMPSALTVHFLMQVPPGSQLRLRAQSLGAGRSLSFWQSELSVGDAGTPAALAMVVLGRRKESDAFTDLSMPEVPAPDALPEAHPPGAFGERCAIRAVTGVPPYNRTDSRSITWVRETSGRALDYVQLAYLSDHYAPRIFFRSPGPRPYATVTLSIYFHAGEAELRRLGDDYVLIDARGSRAEASTVSSRVELWSRQGTLLATTEQLGWFR